MNMMEQIMNDMANRGNGNYGGAAQQSTQRPCGCTAARANARKTGVIVKIIGRPPETQAARVIRQQHYGPRGGFVRSGSVRTPPELQSGTLIKVEKKPVNLMDEILAGLRKR